MNDENDFLGFEEEISTTLEQYHRHRDEGLSERAAMAQAQADLGYRVGMFGFRIGNTIVERLSRDTEEGGEDEPNA